jgi:3',5'-cyclic AMP phosphodiesterase CpdA
MNKIFRLFFVFFLLANSLLATNPFSAEKKLEVFDTTSVNFSRTDKETAIEDEKLEVKNNVIAIMADLHTRQDNLKMIEKAFSRVNSLNNLYGLVLTGDLCRKIGSPAEYKLLESVLKKLSSPVFAVPGNHDLIYKDHFVNGEKRRASPGEKLEKQRRFKRLFNLKSIYYTRRVAGHLLIFLPNDSLTGLPLVLLSDDALDFLRKNLRENPDTPTIVFCHAPIQNSYGEKKTLPPIHANVQPAAKIKKILKANPQVYLWFAGHLHITPGQKFYHFKGNKVGNTNVIHVPPVKNDRAWVQVLRLLPNGAIVRTMDVKSGKFLKKHNRVFAHRIKRDFKKNKPQRKKSEKKSARIVVVNAHAGANHQKKQFGEWLAELEPEVALVSEAKFMAPYMRPAGRVFNAGLETKGQREVAVVVRDGLPVSESDRGKVSPDLGLGIAHDRWWTMVQTRVAKVKTRIYSLHLNAVIQQPTGEPRAVNRWTVTKEALERLETRWKNEIKNGWAVIVGGDLNWNDSRKNARSAHFAPGNIFRRLNMKFVNKELMWLAWTSEHHKLLGSHLIPPTAIPGLVPREHPALNIVLQSKIETKKEKEEQDSKDKSDQFDTDIEEEELIESEDESDFEDFKEVEPDISELESGDSVEILIDCLENDFATGTLEL